MDKEKVIHDLAVAAALYSVHYNKAEIDGTPKKDRPDFIFSNMAMRYEDAYKVIEKVIK